MTYEYTELEKQLFTTLDRYQIENNLNTAWGQCVVYEDSFGILRDKLPEIFVNYTDEWVEELTHIWLEDEDRNTYVID